MSANPELIDYEEARQGFRQIASARRAARERFEEQGLKKAEAEHAYRKSLSIAFGKARKEGEPVGASEILAKAQAADHALERDLAEIRMKSAHEQIGELEAERATLNRLSEWAMKIAPTGQTEDLRRAA